MYEYSNSLINESKVDLESAEILFKAGKYARTVFFCSQCLEKLGKAILAKK